jgi:hypothetical protein
MSEIVNEFGPRDMPPLRILFVVRIEHGYFKAFVPCAPGIMKRDCGIKKCYLTTQENELQIG